MKQCKFTSKLAEIRENLSEQGKDWLVELLPKARLYFPNYSGVQNNRGVRKVAIREYEVLKLRTINSLFRVEAGVLQAVLRQQVLSMGLAFQVSSIKNEIYDMLVKKTYAEQIKRLRQL